MHADTTSPRPPADAERFAAIYARYREPILRYITAQVRDQDRALAEDLTSETFIAAWRSLDRAHCRDDQLHSWLRTIARRTVCHHYRLARNRREVAASGSAVFDRVSVTGAPENAVARYELRRALQNPAAQRKAARWLHHQVKRATGRPISVDMLCRELGVSTYRATRLRRAVVAGTGGAR